MDVWEVFQAEERAMPYLGCSSFLLQLVWMLAVGWNKDKPSRVAVLDLSGPLGTAQ